MAFSDNQERHRKALRSFELKMIIARYRPPPPTLIAAAVLIQIVARQRVPTPGALPIPRSPSCVSKRKVHKTRAAAVDSEHGH